MPLPTTGVPAAVRSVAEWLRDNPDAAPVLVKEPVEVRPVVPYGILWCADEPPPPADPSDVEAIANHYLDVAVACRACRFRLNQVRAYLAQP